MRLVPWLLLAAAALATACGGGASPTPPADVPEAGPDALRFDVRTGTPCDEDDDCAAAFADLGACERAVCGAGRVCAREPLPEWAACDDGDPCTRVTQCVEGACGGGRAIACDDGDPCTDDACGDDGACTHAANDAACDDGDPCTTGDACGSGGCKGLPDPTCTCTGDAECAARDDDDLCNGRLVCGEGGLCGIDPRTRVVCPPSVDEPCTERTCDPATGACGLAPLADGAACDDGNLCTRGDVCTSGLCAGEEACATCASDLDCAPFEDDDLCNGRLTCEEGHCVVAPRTVVRCDTSNDPPCAATRCEPASGACRLTLAARGEACDDGDPCTGDERCDAGRCEGVAVTCDDGDPCTEDLCEEDVGCRSRPTSGEDCDDGDACTTSDRCNDGACRGTAILCDDDDECTADACDPATGCTHVLDPECPCASAADCDDGNPCTDDRCDERARCAYTVLLNDTPCEGVDACFGPDECDRGECREDEPLACGDGNSCTDDTCDPLAGCVFVPVVDCECAVDEDCDDGNPCTGAHCDQVAHRCEFPPVDAGLRCEDEDPCTTGTACDGSGACVGDEPTDCGDGIECTLDTCDPTAGGCQHDGAVCPCRPGDTAGCDDENPCTSDGCERFACAHVDAPDGNLCDDADACTEGDACRRGLCEAGRYVCPEIDCQDGADDDQDGRTDCDDDDCLAAWAGCLPELVCNDRVDSDLDGNTDCDDADCGTAPVCLPESACRNGEDDDEDGRLDCDDLDCADRPVCRPEGECTNALDDDEDGTTDCDDDDCTRNPRCLPEGDCLDRVDGDLDGATDCDDDDCEEAPNCRPEPDCDDRRDEDLDGATDCDDADCARDPACFEYLCGDARDGDRDGATDCDDADCAGTLACTECVGVEALACGATVEGALVGTGASTDYPNCTKPGAGFPGPERVYAFTTAFSGLATMRLTPTFDGALALLERQCRPGTSCLATKNAARRGAAETLVVEVLAGTPYYVAVEGVAAEDTGAFTLALECPQVAERCDLDGDEDRDGLVDCDDPDCATNARCMELTCDDDEDNDHDGLVDCGDPDCGAFYDCAKCAARGTIACGQTMTATTAGGANRMDRYPNCTAGSNYTGPEHVYAFTPTYDLTATIDLVPETHDAILLLLEGTCSAVDSCVARADRGFLGEPEAMTRRFRAGQTYYVIVDGYSAVARGNYALTMTCSAPPELCGNGLDDDQDGATDCTDADCDEDPCDDENACTYGDVCLEGSCFGPSTRPCDDGNDCTLDGCAPESGCTHTPKTVGTVCRRPILGRCDAVGNCRQIVAEGDVILTEILQNPECVADLAGEWLEVYNRTSGGIDLFGWTLRSQNDVDHTIAAHVIVPAFSYALLCANPRSSENGGVAGCDYAYGDLLLGNGSDFVDLVDAAGTTVDSVAWNDGATFPDPAGAAMSLDPSAFDSDANDDGASWCEATDTFGVCTRADRGTPRRVNPSCGGSPCIGAVPLVCGTTVEGDTTGRPDIFAAYPCTGVPQTGGERVYLLATDERSTVRLRLTSPTGADLDLNVLRDNCDTGACLAFGGETLEFTTSPFGEYFVIVDGRAGARGPFSLEVECTVTADEICNDRTDNDGDGRIDCADEDCDEYPFCTEFCFPSPVRVGCGTVMAGTTAGGANDISSYVCSLWREDGVEAVHTFVAESSGPVTFALQYASAEFLDIFVLDSTCGDTTCVGYGDHRATVVAEQGRTYYVVVDGRSRTEGEYVLAVDCGGAIETFCRDTRDDDADGLPDCRDPDCLLHPDCTERRCADGIDDDGDGGTDCDDPDCAETLDCDPCAEAAPLACGETVTGDRAGLVSRLAGYGCVGWVDRGGERVFSFTSPGTGTVTARLESTTTDDAVIVLPGACDAGVCSAAGAPVTFPVTFGQAFLLVVDGGDGDDGTFALTLECDTVPPEECLGGVDEDEDGAIDCEDSDCDGKLGCAELACTDGRDDDGDGAVDCGDPDCATVLDCNACARASDVVCGDVVLGANLSPVDRLDAYACAPWAETGGEAVYRLQPVASVEVEATLTRAVDDLDLVVLEDLCTPLACLVQGVRTTRFTAEAGHTYYLVVDGFEAAAGSFQLAVTCEDVPEACDDGRDNDGDGATDCADEECLGNPVCPERCTGGRDEDGDGDVDCDDPDCDVDVACAALCTTDRAIVCGQTVSGTTVGEANEIPRWDGCVPLSESGGEATHVLSLAFDAEVTVRLADPALDLFVTRGACSNKRCFEWDGGEHDREVRFAGTAGTTYWVVVDGFLGASGPYDLTVTCESHERACTDGRDEDGDGLTDCADPECASEPACVEVCDDALDNDADGATDCADDDCAHLPGCHEVDCADGLDEDADGGADCTDTDCADDPLCRRMCGAAETPGCDRVILETTDGAPALLDAFPGCTTLVSGGGERVYTLTPTVDTTLTATLEQMAPEVALDLVLLEGECASDRCAAFGDTTLTRPLRAGTTYHVVVDGPDGAAGGFALVLDCGQDELRCADDRDDDGDGATDCDDPHCAADAACQPEAACANSFDDDGDGLVDCRDEDCHADPECGCAADATPVACDAVLAADTLGAPARLSLYPCLPGVDADGPERAFAFTAPRAGTFTARLVDANRPLRLLRMGGGCEPAACLAADARAVTFSATAGETVYLVVDGEDAYTGAFLLGLDCGAAPEWDCDDGVDDDDDGRADCTDSDCASAPACAEPCAPLALPLHCGGTLFGTTEGQDARLGPYSCTTWDESGGEAFYRFTAAIDDEVTVRLSVPPGADLDLLVLSEACDASRCLASGGSEATFPVERGETYYVVVDGAVGRASLFALNVECVLGRGESDCADGEDDDADGAEDCADLDCTADPACVGATCTPDGALACGMALADTTAGQPDELSTYGCFPLPSFGGERVYRFTSPEVREVTVALSEPSTDLDVFVLSGACGSAMCDAWADTAATFTAQPGETYYVVVDGRSAGGSYLLDVFCR